MTTFDKETFMNAEVIGAMETVYTPVPEGEWQGYVKEVDPREVNDEPVIDLTWVIIDDRVKEQLGIDEPTVRQTLFLDFDSNGVLSFGPNKNVQLGRVREVAGLNDPAAPFNFRMLQGIGPFTLKIDHRADKKDPSKVYADVKHISAA